MIDKKNNKGHHWFLYILSSIAIIISTIAICGYHIGEQCIINDQSIVLTTVGILATFVVVSNYAQVKEIESRIQKEIKIYTDIAVQKATETALKIATEKMNIILQSIHNKENILDGQKNVLDPLSNLCISIENLKNMPNSIEKYRMVIYSISTLIDIAKWQINHNAPIELRIELITDYINELQKINSSIDNQFKECYSHHKIEIEKNLCNINSFSDINFVHIDKIKTLISEIQKKITI